MFFKLLICWIVQNNTNPSKCKLQFSQILGDVKGLNLLCVSKPMHSTYKEHNYMEPTC